MQGQPFVLSCDDTDLCDDILLLRNALQQIQSHQTAQSPPLHGGTRGGLFLDNCGTAMRFLTAYCAVQDGLDITLTGSERMHQRPIGQLVDALRSVGADIEYLGNEGYPPLRIHGKAIPRTPITLNDVDSSQFISALMLVGFPIETNDTSPYIQMTQELIDQVQQGEPITIERDWSAASYWYEYVALYGGEILFPDLYFQTLQGDSVVAEIFESLGVKSQETTEGILIKQHHDFKRQTLYESPLHVNFADCPDLYPAVYVTCYKLGIKLKAQGIERLPHKESNRLKAFDQLASQTPILHSYSDHRIAMALLVAGYQVDDIDCISKSYPQFINQLRNVTFIVPYKHDSEYQHGSADRSERSGDKNIRNSADTHIVYVDDEGLGKKHALHKGISQATTEYVWLTDADVSRTHYPIFVPPTLLGDLTILPLRMETIHYPLTTNHCGVAAFQTTEYLAIQSLTLWAAERGHAVMCSGANLIVNREHWLASYPDLHPEIPSGDDMFLLESFKCRKLTIKALYAPKYIATIQPEPTWEAFFRQRMRWAGKAPKYRDKDILLCGTLTFIANLLVFLCPLLVIFKYPFDLHFIRKAQDYNLTTNHLSLTTALWALLLAVAYPYYMFICLIGGLIRQHKW